MKNYRTLLFDIDDTLLDFGAAEKVALRLLFEEQKLDLTVEMVDTYKRINQMLWKSFEDGKISRDEVVHNRFTLLFKEYGKEVDGAKLESSYRSFLEEGNEFVDGALEVITALHKQFDLYIVTNGFSKTQDRRLRDSGLYPFFKGIFVSEDTGFQKPMPEFFDYVFARIPNIELSTTMIIGDSLSADIKGGNLAGIDSCWLNPNAVPNTSSISPTYEIQRLEELYPLLQLNELVIS